MASRILIADDEQTFLESTADLLRRAGYAVDCAEDAGTAAQLLRGGAYDLLIADINMPGNPELELISAVRHLAAGLPVILVTGYPSTKTAIQAVQLAVVSYLVKPFEFAALRDLVRQSLERCALYKSMAAGQDRLRAWLKDLQAAGDVLAAPERVPAGVVAESYLATTLHNILLTLYDLSALCDTMGKPAGEADACAARPRPAILLQALRDSIGVLERTKGSFKSRELKALRERLEQIVALEGGSGIQE